MSEFVLPRGRSMIDQPPDRYSGRHVVNPAITPEVEPEANPEVLDARLSVPVTPVLAFAGSGIIAVHGVPRGVIITSYNELSRVLNSRGRRLAQSTVDKLYSLATNPSTWMNPPYVPLAERYKWYPE